MLGLRTKISAVGSAAVLVLGATGCADSETNDPGGDTADASALLTSAAEAMWEESFKIEMTVGELMTMNGAIDTASGLSEMTMSMSQPGMTMDIQFIATETDVWMNLGDMGAMIGADGWVQMDVSAFAEFTGMDTNSMYLGSAEQWFESMSGVEQIDDRTFEGTLDPTDASWIQDDMLAGLEDTTTTFTATLDEKNRLSSMVMELPEVAGAPPGMDSVETRYYDYGVPLEISEPPADEIVPMPDALREMLDQS